MATRLLYLAILLFAGCATSPSTDGTAGSCTGAGVVRKDEPQLVAAAKTGDAGKVKALLDSGVDINAKNMFCESALLWAVLNGHTETAELLLAKGSVVNEKDDIGRTPLMMASANGNEALVQAMISKGASASAHLDKTVVFWRRRSTSRAIEVHSSDRTQKPYTRSLSDSGLSMFIDSSTDTAANLDNRIMVPGDTALTLAARFGHVSVVQLLLGKGSGVNAKGKNGRSPLAWAAKNGHSEIVKILAAKGADRADEDKPLQRAIAAGHMATVRVLLDAGWNVNGELGDGLTALMLAAKDGNAELVDLLLSKNADAKATTEPVRHLATSPDPNGGKTALMWAAEAGHANAVRSLLAAGSDVNLKRRYRLVHGDGRTALMYASQRGNAEILDDLLRSGADAGASDESGITAMMLAALAGHTDVLRRLIGKGAAVNAKVQRTQVWRPSEFGGVGEMLAANQGLRMRILTAKGTTALIYAAMNGHVDAVRILLQSGADVNAKVEDNVERIGGYTALRFAQERGHEAVAQLLTNFDK